MSVPTDFQAKLDVEDGTATVWLSGELDSRSAAVLDELVTRAVEQHVRRIVLLAGELTYLSSAGLRCLVFAHQKLGRTGDIVLVGARPEVAETIRLTGFDRAIVMQSRAEP
ncbi:STAS domain-containing protein [Amycolatopsis sp. NPDC049688]|uniref:STAS domain-containing protein n=1 Tax=Amycolatopsis sp. NPDC049688 TaxID=3154733 RepID=UPI00342CAE83